MLAGALLLASMASPQQWLDSTDARSEAEKSKKLVLTYVENEAALERGVILTMLDPGRSGTTLKSFVLTKKEGKASALVASDSDDRPRGLLSEPFNSQTADLFIQTVDQAWRRHDALKFHAKGRIDDEKAALLAFSFAARGETESAKGTIDHISKTYESDLLGLAILELSQAYEREGRAERSEDCCLLIESRVRNPELIGMARVALAKLWLEKNPAQAKVKLRQVMDSEAVSIPVKQFASELLKRL